MKILGIDPGLAVTGYGVIQVDPNGANRDRISLVEAGVVRTKPSDGIALRLHRIYRSLSDVIAEFKPDVMAVEKLYAHYEHPTTSILMGHVRGVACLLSGLHEIPLVSVATTHVKKAVTGRGHAKKWQVQEMVQRTLRLKERPEPPDVADALAVAISYVARLKMSGKGAGSL